MENILTIKESVDSNEIKTSPEERGDLAQILLQHVEETKLRRLGAISVHDVEEEDVPLLVVKEGNDEIPLISKGSLTVLCGAAKNGKSTLGTLLQAAMLKENGTIGCLKRVNSCKVGYIDTEQRPSDTLRCYKRVLELAGLPEEDDYSKLVVYNQRAFFKDKKNSALEEICEISENGILFVDNSVDYVSNFNENEQSQSFLEHLMIYSAQYNVALVVVIHTNKKDNNSRGHLGSILEQKADNVLLVKKERSGFKVSNKASRRMEIPDFRFWYDENNQLCVEENSITERALNTTMPSKSEMAETAIVGYLLEDCDDQKATKKEIVEFLEDDDICKKSFAYGVIKKMLDNGMLLEDENHQIFYCDSDAADELLSDDNQDITDQNVCLFNYSYPQRRL